jgi:tight adherence protein C
MLLALIASATAALLCLGLSLRFYRREGHGAAAEVVKPATAGAPRRWARLGALLRPADGASAAKLSRRLSHAGIPGADAVDFYLALRLGSLLCGILLFLAVLRLLPDPLGATLALLVITAAALLGPSLWLEGRTAKRHQQISQSLPPTLDLLVTCLDAGLSLEPALRRVAYSRLLREDLLAQQLRITLEEMRAGLSLTKALQRLDERLGHEELNNLALLLAQASLLGSSLQDALRAHSHQLRSQRLLVLEEQAGKTNAKLTLPLTLCLLPSIMIFLLGPALLLMRQLMQ